MGKEGEMTVEELANRLCKSAYLKHCEECKKRTTAAFSREEYCEMNREYFIERAKIYLEVKACLEAKQ